MSKSECQRQSNWKVKFKKVTYLKPSDVIFGRVDTCCVTSSHDTGLWCKPL